MGSSAEYVFDNAAPQTSGRFGALEALFDGLTERALEPLIAQGSRCLEVGGGSGSIASWMAQQVSETGCVVVTDIDPSHLPAASPPVLEVRRHDIVNDSIEESYFDLVHARLVLIHLPDRLQALDRMARALRPGGWLVVQEFDSLTLRPDPTAFPRETYLPTLAAMWDLMQTRGVQLSFGRELFHEFRALGLEAVEASGHVQFSHGGSTSASLLRANFLQLREALLASGGVSKEQFEADLGRLEDSDVAWPSPTLWTALGRKH